MIETGTFTLSNLIASDASDLSGLMVSNAERFRRFFPNTLAQNKIIDDAKEYISKKKKKIRAKEEFTWAIKSRSNDLVAGLIILKELDWDKKQGELAYCIGLEHEGQGWMTKTVQEISSYAFKELGLKTLQIIVHKSNKGSIKVAQKCGYGWQRTLKKSYTPPDEAPLDMELYELYA